MTTAKLAALIQTFLDAVNTAETGMTVEEIMEEAGLRAGDSAWESIRRVSSFADAALMTRDDGVVVTLEDGTSLHVSVR